MNSVHLIALSGLFRTSPRRLREALQHYASPEETFTHLVEWAPDRLEDSRNALRTAEGELAFIRQHQLSTYYIFDENYPNRLRQCEDAPILLFGKGNLHFDGPFLSIVGTRRATERGRETTTRIVQDLAKLVPNLTIVSGLAYGIDVAAHRAAIDAGLPTIIVPAHGLDRIYPALHRPVAIAALEKGGILTEYPSGTEPEQWNFVARNRIVAGLSDATLVVESNARGGSLITANLAFDYSRELFAVPGRPADAESAGCNDLIRANKAHLITSAEDIIDAMQWVTVADPQLDLFAEAKPMPNLTQTQQSIWQALSEHEDGMHINTLVQQLSLPFPTVSAQLTLLELQGHVRSLPGGMYRIVQ